MKRENIKKVHVVFKTHLDIGFTDTAENVMQSYTNEYIPRAIEIAKRVNTDKKRFVWTVGSYVIDYFLKHAAPEACNDLCRAIERGDIVWHAMSCTLIPSLLDDDLMDYTLGISARLDKRFKKKTVAAKMTDVLRHPMAIIRKMEEHGVKYLHLGSNGGFKFPSLPSAFLWRDGDNELVVQCNGEYGSACYFEGMDEVMEFAHTNDNHGPQSEAEIERIYALLAEKYPNAEIFGSCMDAFAQTLLKCKDKLPVITEDFGDGNIDQVCIDPIRSTRYRILIELKNKWKSEGRFEKLTFLQYDGFMSNMMLVAEHTCGMDFSHSVGDYVNWSKKDFQAAKKADKTTGEHFNYRLRAYKEQYEFILGHPFEGAYSKYEQAYLEQRAYIDAAINSLPEDMSSEAYKTVAAFESRIEIPCEQESEKLKANHRTRIGDWEFSFGHNGALNYLAKEGRAWITTGSFGHLLYSTYNAVDDETVKIMSSNNLRENGIWIDKDRRNGGEFVPSYPSKDFDFVLEQILLKDNTVYVIMTGEEECTEEYGCPRNAIVRYEFGEKITCKLQWWGKDENKLIENINFSCNFNVGNPYRIKFKRLGRLYSPFNTMRAGTRGMYFAGLMYYDGADGKLSVESRHASCICLGRRKHYWEQARSPYDISCGYNYLLYHNNYITNGAGWFGEDCSFEFVIDIENSK